MGLATLKSDIYANLTSNPTIANTGATVYPLTPEQGAVKPFLYFAVGDPTEGLTLRGGWSNQDLQVTSIAFANSSGSTQTISILAGVINQ